MCTVAAASGAASVRVWHITSRGWDPWTERPLPEVVRVAYPLLSVVDFVEGRLVVVNHVHADQLQRVSAHAIPPGSWPARVRPPPARDVDDALA